MLAARWVDWTMIYKCCKGNLYYHGSDGRKFDLKKKLNFPVSTDITLGLSEKDFDEMRPTEKLRTAIEHSARAPIRGRGRRRPGSFLVRGWLRLRRVLEYP